MPFHVNASECNDGRLQKSITHVAIRYFVSSRAAGVAIS